MTSKPRTKLMKALDDLSVEVKEKRLDPTLIKKQCDEIERMMISERRRWLFRDKRLDEFQVRYNQLKGVYHKEIEQSVIIIEIDGKEEQRHKQSKLVSNSVSYVEREMVETKEDSKSCTTSSTKEIKGEHIATESTFIAPKKEDNKEGAALTQSMQSKATSHKKNGKAMLVILVLIILVVILLTIIGCLLFV